MLPTASDEPSTLSNTNDNGDQIQISDSVGRRTRRKRGSLQRSSLSNAIHASHLIGLGGHQLPLGPDRIDVTLPSSSHSSVLGPSLSDRPVLGRQFQGASRVVRAAPAWRTGRT